MMRARFSGPEIWISGSGNKTSGFVLWNFETFLA